VLDAGFSKGFFAPPLPPPLPTSATQKSFALHLEHKHCPLPTPFHLLLHYLVYTHLYTSKHTFLFQIHSIDGLSAKEKLRHLCAELYWVSFFINMHSLTHISVSDRCIRQMCYRLCTLMHLSYTQAKARGLSLKCQHDHR
jgi:hypothetical protein